MIRYISTTILIFLTTINIHAQVADSIYSLGSKFYNSNAAARFGKQALREELLEEYEKVSFPDLKVEYDSSDVKLIRKKISGPGYVI